MSGRIVCWVAALAEEAVVMDRFSYTAAMSRPVQARKLNMQAFAQEGEPLHETTPLQDLARLAAETPGLAADASVVWSAQAQLRPSPGHEDAVWLHLEARAVVPLTCQRCMTPVPITVEVDQRYRFVATEEIAMAEDDQSEEDLLVMVPQFDLLEVLEDELLMALPVVPMHDSCPVAPQLTAGEDEMGEAAAEKPHPFAVLAQLKAKK